MIARDTRLKGVGGGVGFELVSLGVESHSSTRVRSARTARGCRRADGRAGVLGRDRLGNAVVRHRTLLLVLLLVDLKACAEEAVIRTGCLVDILIMPARLPHCC